MSGPATPRDPPPAEIDLTDTLPEPGELLGQVALDLPGDSPVTIRTRNPDDAKAVLDLLAHPYQATTETGVTLFHEAGPVTFPDGTAPVVPKRTGKITWRLHEPGEISLHAGANQLLCTPTEDIFHPDRYRTPVYTVEAEAHRIYSPDGILVSTGLRKDTLAGYAMIPRPHIPFRPDYLDMTRVTIESPDSTSPDILTPSQFNIHPEHPHSYVTADTDTVGCDGP